MRGVFAHRPAVYAAWRQLLGAITAEMDERLYELVTLAAAGSLRSSYCSLAHGQVLLERHVSRGRAAHAGVGARSAPLSPCGVRSDAICTQGRPGCDGRIRRRRPRAARARPVRRRDLRRRRRRGRSLLLQQDPRCARRTTRPGVSGADAGAAQGAGHGSPDRGEPHRGRIDLAANTQIDLVPEASLREKEKSMQLAYVRSC